MQHARGRLALTPTERERLADWYEEAVAGSGQPSEERSVLELLTRPFSRAEIPEYYRYTSLHVYDWFLTPHQADPVTAGLTALRVTLLDLAAREREQRAPLPGFGAAESAERRARLAALIDTLDTPPDRPGGWWPQGPPGEPGGPGEPRRELSVLVRCTGFPQSDVHHEHLFLRSVHACEVVFFLARWTACRAIAAITADDLPQALLRTRQTARCAELLTGILHVLRTLSPEQFMSFRAATGDASAVQSLNYHLAELAVYGYDPRKTEVFLGVHHLHPLNEPPYRDLWPLRSAVRAADQPELTEAFAAVEQALLTWRGRHYGFGRRYLPRELKGSGGTEGAGYLKRIVDKTPCLPGPSGPVPEEMFRFARC
ncbi:tryptophan 2,3-dioxygenase family protein [Kitasatospora sp. NBC_01287]|uniref:tryptophan 2,3-dioxygenase family protein n=1 Tax=Kitasatospora sp. NBC_01287 TaxID=2903573 RepID=UPI00225A965D|nr:tryptophan 2,3-dioxygenase family protein [Kitasatospora sp. NBC_01287]MCX4749994.1 tryptophan 2,3-dioxygenase family protein [Kitasatospora sp. NBC_01287]